MLREAAVSAHPFPALPTWPKRRAGKLSQKFVTNAGKRDVCYS